MVDIDIDDVNDRHFYSTLEELIRGHEMGMRVTHMLDATAMRFVLKKRIVELGKLKGRSADMKLCQRFLEILDIEASQKGK